MCTILFHLTESILFLFIGNAHTDWMLNIAWLHRMYAENIASILSYINVLHAYYRSEFVLPAEYIDRVRAANKVSTRAGVAYSACTDGWIFHGPNNSQNEYPKKPIYLHGASYEPIRYDLL